MKKLIFIMLLIIFIVSSCKCAADIEAYMCDEVMEDKDHCYKDAATRFNEEGYCEKIVDPAPKSKCYLELAGAMGNFGLCEKMPPGPGAYDKPQCYMLIAIYYKDPKMCEKMGDYQHSSGNDVTPGPINREACLDKIYGKCGSEGGSCCADGSCDTSLKCVEVYAQPSSIKRCARTSEGAEGQSCFTLKDSQFHYCQIGLTCNSAGKCVTGCGSLGGMCCHEMNNAGYPVCNEGWINYAYEMECVNDVCVKTSQT
ncbi:MAG: hypothetical protein ABIH34_02405 [Nanoarchaeota archaeon]